MEFTIKSGAKMDLLSPKEMKEYFDKKFEQYYARPLYMKIPWSSQNNNLPLTIAEVPAGFIWSVKLLSAVFTVSAQLFVYTDDDTDSNLEDHDSAGTAHALRYTSNTFVINGGQVIIVESGGTATKASGLLRIKQVPVGYEHLL